MLTGLQFSFDFSGPFLKASVIFANLSGVGKMQTSIMNKVEKNIHKLTLFSKPIFNR